MRIDVLLLYLIDNFYRREFSFSAAYRLLGPAAKETEDRILLKPLSGSNLQMAFLEKLEAGVRGPFLAGISLRFKDPVPVNFNKLRKRFGEPTETPRLKPDQEIPYQFLVKGFDHGGYFLLRLPAGSKPNNPQVTSAILRRFPSGK